jgi:urease accessory protein
LNSDRPGRDGLLCLGFEQRGSATILRRCRYKLPLQVLSPLILDDGTSYLFLLNPTGGVLGGDHLHSEVTLEENARVCLATPSATRVYRTADSPAEIETILRVGRNATLEYLPDHVIPHSGSRLRQSLRVEMSAGSRGIFFEGFASGRVALSEHWKFRDFDSRTEIVLCGQPIYLSRTKIHPQEFAPARPGRMGDYDYSGSLLIIADQFDDWRPVLAALRAELEAFPGILGGGSLLCEAGCSMRYLAKSAIDFHAATNRLWTTSRRQVLQLPPLDLRKY